MNKQDSPSKGRPLTATQRARKNVTRYKKAGLKYFRVCAHPGEAADIRAYAAKQPLTKAIREKLK